jgi:hypothetical protein
VSAINQLWLVPEDDGGKKTAKQKEKTTEPMHIKLVYSELQKNIKKQTEKSIIARS